MSDDKTITFYDAAAEGELVLAVFRLECGHGFVSAHRTGADGALMGIDTRCIIDANAERPLI